MQDRFKVGDYVIFRRGMHKVADMLNTSFYDVLTSVYEITGTEGRCYLMKSGNGRGRVWKIRKSRIDKLGTRVIFADKHIDEFERLQHKCEKEALEELAKAKEKTDATKRKELADAFIKDVEKFIKGAEAMTEAMCRIFDRCCVRERLDVYDIDINKLKGDGI